MTADTALEKTGTTVLAAGNLTRDQVDLIKRTICEDFTDDELSLFLLQAQRKGLDPLSREIYGFKGKDGRISIVVGIDGFRSRADETGNYMPGQEPTFTLDERKNMVSATAYVKRWDERTEQWVEVSATAWLTEQKRGAPIWSKAPRVMLAKCAEAFAFRRAFPSQLGGMYASEEMPGKGEDDGGTAPRMRQTQPAPEPTPRALIWRVASELGLSGEDVKDTISGLGLPEDSSKLTLKDVEQVCVALRAQWVSRNPPVAEATATPAEPISWHQRAVNESVMLAATDEQWDMASEKALTLGLMPGDWTEAAHHRMVLALAEVCG